MEGGLEAIHARRKEELRTYLQLVAARLKPLEPGAVRRAAGEEEEREEEEEKVDMNQGDGRMVAGAAAAASSSSPWR